MDVEKLARVLAEYECAIDYTYSHNPVRIPNHPIEHERKIVYGFESAHYYFTKHKPECINTRQALDLNCLSAQSVKEEMMFLMLACYIGLSQKKDLTDSQVELLNQFKNYFKQENLDYRLLAQLGVVSVKNILKLKQVGPKSKYPGRKTLSFISEYQKFMLAFQSQAEQIEGKPNNKKQAIMDNYTEHGLKAGDFPMLAKPPAPSDARDALREYSKEVKENLRKLKSYYEEEFFNNKILEGFKLNVELSRQKLTGSLQGIEGCEGVLKEAQFFCSYVSLLPLKPEVKVTPAMLWGYEAKKQVQSDWPDIEDIETTFMFMPSACSIM